MDNTLSSLTPSVKAFQPPAADLNKMSAQNTEAPVEGTAGDTFEKSEPAAAEKKAKPSPGMKEYTILAYMDGSNNLEDCILEDLIEMENCPQAENYNLVAQFSRFNTKPFTVLFLAEALTHAFKSPDFKAVIKEIVGDSELVKNYGEILKDPDVCQTISQLLLSQNPELNDRLDKVVSERVKDSIGKNRTLDKVLSETAVEILKGVCVNEAMAKEAEQAEAEPEDAEKSARVSSGGTGPVPVTLSAQPPSLLEIFGEEKKEVSLGEALARATAGFIKSAEGKQSVDLLSGGVSGSKPSGNVFFVESGRPGKPQLNHADYSEIFGGVDEVETNKEPAWRGVRRYEVQHSENSGKINSPVLKDLGFTDMSEGKTLSDFLSWGIKKYPAKHYIVLLSDHGAGFLGAEEDRGGLMSLPAMKEAFEKVKEKTGVKPDIIAFDTCLMAQAEVAYELKDSARYLVASEEVVGGDGYPYSEILPRIDESIKEGKTDPKDITQIFIEEAESVNEDTTLTLSAIDLSAAGKVADAANTLAKHILDGKASLDDVRDSIKQAQNYSVGTTVEPYSDFRDLWDLADKLENNPNIKNREIKKDLKELKMAVEMAVVHEEHKDDEDYQGSHGMSIYAPRRQKSVSVPLMEKYDEIRMSKRTKWNELVKALTDYKELEAEVGDEGARKLTFIPLPQRK